MIITSRSVVTAGERLGRAGPGLAAGSKAECRRRLPPDSGLGASLILLLAAELVFCAFWPGIVHWDAAHITSEAHRHVAIDWWTGIGTLFLQQWFSLGLGLPLVWAGIVAANIVGIYGCLRAVLQRVPAAVATLCVVVFPPIYGQLAAVSRDSAYVGFALLAFAALAKLVRGGDERRRRLLAAALTSAMLAAVSRQNGISVVFAVTLFIALLRPNGIRRGAVRAGIVACLVMAGAYGALKLADAASGVRSVHPERMTFVYDLAAISVASGYDLFPQRGLRALGPGAASPPDLTEASLKHRFRGWSVTSLRGVDEMDVENSTLARGEATLLQRAWVRAFEHQPIRYLSARAGLYVRLLGLGEQPRSAPKGFFYGYQGLDEPTNYGHPLAFPRGYAVATGMLGWFIGLHAVVPLDRPWMYLLLAVSALAYLRRRRSPRTLLAASMCAAVTVNQMIISSQR